MFESRPHITKREILQMRPSHMVVVVYDELFAALREAKVAIEQQDIESRCHAVNYASEMIALLCLCLDHAKGGEIAERLSKLYAFALVRLQNINFYNDAETADELIALLQPLRKSWFELDERLEALSDHNGAAVRHRFSEPSPLSLS